MNRYLNYTLALVIVISLVVWAISTFIQPILPANINSGLIFYFVIFVSIVSLLSNLKDVAEFVKTVTDVKHKKVEEPKIEKQGNHAEIKNKVLHNLPHPTYENFIGRRNELAKIFNLLDPANRNYVISIDGIGGVGKSALALRVAYSYVSNSEDFKPEQLFSAVVWVSAKRSELTGIGIRKKAQTLHSIDDIYTEIAITLDRKTIIQAPIEKQDALIPQLLTQHRVLLIIDNLETIDDERINDFIERVPLPSKVIVTTRHRFNVASVIPLMGMKESEALVLIIEKCKQHDVVLTDHEIQQLYKRTGGVPLAIGWSIAQISLGFPVERVIARLSESTSDIAKYCFEGVLERIRENPSYTLIMALALFATDANRIALGYVSDLPELIRDEGLVELERLSLVNKSRDRFQMLPLTLSYTKSKLADDTKLEQKLRVNWLNYYEEFLREQGQKYENVPVVMQEMLNIFTVLDWCIEANKPKNYVTLLKVMNFYLWASGNWNSWNHYLIRGPELARSIGDLSSMADFLGWLASMRYYQNSLEEATDLANQAITLYKQLGDKSEFALVLRRLASIQIKSRDIKGARENLEMALALASEVDNGRYISRIQRQIAKLDIDDGNYLQAEDRLNQALAYREKETKVSSGLAYTYRLYGKVKLLQNDYSNSKKYFQHSYEISVIINSQPDVAETKLGLAELALAQEDLEEALVLVQEAIEIFQRLKLEHEVVVAGQLLDKIKAKLE